MNPQQEPVKRVLVLAIGQRRAGVTCGKSALLRCEITLSAAGKKRCSQNQLETSILGSEMTRERQVERALASEHEG